MKILQIAPIAIELNPNLKYGGTERVIWNLDKGLADRGIESLVAAPKNSSITGRLLPTLDVNVWSYTKDNSEMLERYEEHCKKIIEYVKKEKPDIVHDHDAGFVLYSGIGPLELDAPIVSTLHYSDIDGCTQEKWDRIPNRIKNDVKFVSISNSQKKIVEDIVGICVDRVIYHGLDLNKFPLSEERGNYLFSAGRISQVKGQDLAIHVAKETKENLIIGGPVQKFVKESIDFFKNKIKPNIDYDFSDKSKPLKDIIKIANNSQGKIFYIGEYDDNERNLLNLNSKCFLMPQRWKEGFGLVMVEAMACGNPVIGFNNGSVPEIIDYGINGYVVKDVEEMTRKVKEIKKIKPIDCRSTVENKFNLNRQVREYVDLYKSVLEKK